MEQPDHTLNLKEGIFFVSRFTFGRKHKLSNNREKHNARKSTLTGLTLPKSWRVAVISAKNHKCQRRKRQSVTAKREKSQTPKVLTVILTLPNLTKLNLT